VILPLTLAAGLSAVSFPDIPIAARYEIVEALGATDAYAAMAINPQNDHPVVALIDTSTLNQTQVRPADLFLRRYDGWTWQRERIGSVPMLGSLSDNIRDLRIAINPAGRVFVLLIEPNGVGAADDTLVTIEAVPGAPQRTVLDVGQVISPSLSINANGEPIAAWVKQTQTDRSGELRVRQRFLGNWSVVSVTPGARTALPTFAAKLIQNSPELIFAEISATEHRVRHAVINGSQVSLQDIASFQTSAGDSLQWQYFAQRADGSAEIAMIIARPPTAVGAPIPHIVHRRVRATATGGFACATACIEDLPTLSSQGFASSALALGPGSRRAFTFRDRDQRFRIFREDLPRAAFSELAVSQLAKVHDVAYNSTGQLHALALDFSNHRDLILVRELPPWVNARIPTAELGPAIGGVSRAFAMTVAEDGSPVVYGRRSSNDGPGAVWQLENGGFVEYPLPTGLRITDVTLIARESLHMVFRNDLDQRAYYARLRNGVWLVEAVSPEQTHFDDLSLGLAVDDAPRMMWREGSVLRLAARTNQVWVVRDLTVAGVMSPIRAKMIAVENSHIAYVAWFDTVIEQLRVVFVAGDIALSPQSEELALPKPPAGWSTGAFAFDISRSDAGLLSLAFTETVGASHRLAYMYRDGHIWRTLGFEPTAFGAPVPDRIWLDHGMGSARSPRIMWTVPEAGASRLFYAENTSFGGSWRIQDLGQVQFPTANLALDANGLPHLAYSELGSMRVARKLEIVNGESIGPVANSSPSPLALCLCILQFFGPHLDCFTGEIDRSKFNVTPDAGFGSTFKKVRRRFASTAAGRYYSDLYQRFGPEILTLTFANQTLHELHARTLEDFKPALIAFAEGNGGNYVLSPQMLVSARQVWEGWAQFGSPELAAVIQFELLRSNNLQAYINLSFEQWFQALQPGPGAMLANGFE
jgi:hypothetical protein